MDSSLVKVLQARQRCILQSLGRWRGTGGGGRGESAGSRARAPKRKRNDAVDKVQSRKGQCLRQEALELSKHLDGSMRGSVIAVDP